MLTLNHTRSSPYLTDEVQFSCELLNISRSTHIKKTTYRGKRSGFQRNSRRTRPTISTTYQFSAITPNSAYACTAVESDDLTVAENSISVIIGNRPTPPLLPNTSRTKYLVSPKTDLSHITQSTQHSPPKVQPPHLINSLYLLNPTSIAKPNALQQITTDISIFNIDIAVIVETWLKTNHSDAQFNIPGMNLYRHDRQKRKGGGVAIYCNIRLNSKVINFEHIELFDRLYELLWICLSDNYKDVIICGIYHPPKPLYDLKNLLSHFEACYESILLNYRSPTIIVAGDFNNIPNSVFSSLGLLNNVEQPTHMGHYLDRMYTSEPVFTSVKVLSSSVCTHHKAVVACLESTITDMHKARKTVAIRHRTPGQFANLFNDLSNFDFQVEINPAFFSREKVEYDFNLLYENLYFYLNKHFPERNVTLTSRDPYFISAYTKSLLRKKNKHMRAGKIEAANALSNKINVQISKTIANSFTNLSQNTDQHNFWKKISEIRGTKSGNFDNSTPSSNPTISSESLNNHYSLVSTDRQYEEPPLKETCSPSLATSLVSPMSTYHLLNNLGRTAAGPDNIPAWYLQALAPFLATPLSQLLSISFSLGFVPDNWKSARISPIAKVSAPTKPADYRPISITCILSRITEKLFLRYCMYPFLSQPSVAPLLLDQYAFKPTGSTTASLIHLFDIISQTLITQPYVHVIALDLSKAFDTVRHKSVTNTIARLGLRDEHYNFIRETLRDRHHTTLFHQQESSPASINSSVVQGSPTGPINFILNMSNLTPKYSLTNKLSKYADDTYLIVPASASHTISEEIEHIENWAEQSNLTLNKSKTKEIIFSRPRFDRSLLPPPIPEIERVDKLPALGITIANDFSLSAHVEKIISKGNQTLYGIKILKAHGLANTDLHRVTDSLLTGIFMYACPAWWGFLSKAEIAKINSVLRKAFRWGFLSHAPLSFEEMCHRQDDNLFAKILANDKHCLHHLLPPVRPVTLSLRNRPHNRTLPSNSTTLTKKTFITRMLFKHTY